MIKAGTSWKSASGYSMNYSWLLRLHIEQDEEFVNNLSYNIYREDSLIASNITSTIFTDPEEKNIGDSICYNIGVVYNNNDILYSDKACLIVTPTEPEPEPEPKPEDPEPDEDKTPRLYPNPTNDIVNIYDDSIRNVRIYSITGNLLLEESVNCNKLEIDMRGFSQGLYLIQVVTETETKVYKVVRS